MAKFGDARFGHSACIDQSVFAGDARFGDVTFGRHAWFDRAVFRGSVGFAGADFRDAVRFTETTLAANQNPQWPAGFPEPPGIIRQPAQVPTSAPTLTPTPTQVPTA